MSLAKQVEALREDRRRLRERLHLAGEHNRQLLEEIKRLAGILEKAGCQAPFRAAEGGRAPWLI